MTPGREGQKLVGFGLQLHNWVWMGSRSRDFDPGDVKWISTEEFWYLKTMWPDHIFDLTPKRGGFNDFCRT